MITPAWLSIPSESTIEVLTDHYILHHLNKSAAWIFVPTRREEKKVGFDASLQNTKVAIIQYKRIQQINQASVRVDLDANQHDTLLDQFQSANRPYVFYCFSRYKTYQALDDHYTQAGGPRFFENCVFFNALDIPYQPTSVNMSDDGELVLNPSRTPLKWWNGREWCHLFWKCELGITRTQYSAVSQPLQDDDPPSSSPRVSMLLAALPSAQQQSS